MIISTTFAKIEVLVFSRRYRIPIIFKYDFDCGRQRVSTLSELIQVAFFIYLSIIWRLRDEATLLVTIVMLAQSMHTKSAITSDLIFFNTLLRLVTCMLEDSMNLALFLLLMGMITCFLEEPFVVIFNLGLGFPTSLMILQILLILFACNLGKVFLIFRMLLVFGDEACIRDAKLRLKFFHLKILFFIFYFDLSFFSFLNLGLGLE